MAMDTREDAGQYYPRGKVIPRQPSVPGSGPHASTHGTDGNDPVSPGSIGAIENPTGGNVGDVLKKTATGTEWGEPGSATLDDTVTQSSANGVKSSGIWSFVKGLLPNWLTSSFGQPYTKTEADELLNGKVAANDPRLTDARTPTAHAASHAVGGSDELKSKRLYNAGETQYIGGDKVVHISASDWTKEPSTSPADILWFSTFEEAVASTWIWTESQWQGPGWYINDGHQPGISAYSSDANATRIEFEDIVIGDTVVFTRTLASTETLATASDITSAVSTHNAANDAHGTKFGTKADKVASATSGNFAGLDVNGNLTDSGKKAADFATAQELRYALATATAALADRTINAVTVADSAVALTFPAATANRARDFLIFIDSSAMTTGTLSVTVPSGATVYGDAWPTVAANKLYLVTVTEISANVFYVRNIELTEQA